MSTVRAALESLPLFASTSIAGVAVSRPSLLAYKVGDVTHDLDTAEHVLEGRLPLRGPVWGFGRWSETWLLVERSRAYRRVASLRDKLGRHNVRQDKLSAPVFSPGEPATLSIVFCVPRGAAIPPVELPAQDRRAA